MTGTNRRNRSLPYLHRNWIKATNHWDAKMGNKVSAPSRDSGDKSFDHDDQFQRAAKRRRIDNDYDGFPLLEGHAKAKRALRIEVLKICHKDSPRLKSGIMNGIVAPNVKDIAHVRARCKLTICSRQGGEQVVLHVDSQVCDLKIFKNPAASSAMARFASLAPFHIPEDKIYLERDDDAVFGLANSYTVNIELESAGDPNWPPSGLVSVGDEDAFYSRGLPTRQWALTASIADIFNSRNRKEIRLRVKKQPQQDIVTNFIMDIDVRWLTPISSQLVMRAQEKDILPSITVFDPNEPIHALVSSNTNGTNGVSGANGIVNGTNGVNGINGHHPEPLVNGDADGIASGHTSMSLDQPEELAEGELTPSRSRRTRAEINYNVKQMWNNAVGKETKKRRRHDEENGQVDEHTITYLLPPEQVQTERYGCLICGAENDRLNQLRAHYLSHPQYDFRFEVRPKGGCCVSVTHSAQNDGSPLRPKIYQLGLPVKPLDLDKYVEGDESWITSRLGPDDGREVEGNFAPVKAAPKLAPKRMRKKVFVPNIKQPLFDPLSKVQLIPGAEVRQYPVEDAWLLRKHRDNLQDFLDVEPSEKEYMQEWDAYVLKKHISSDHFLPRAFLGFVKQKASWIVATRSRSEEFSKHVSMLLARRAINEAVIIEVTQKINDARLEGSKEAVTPTPSRPKSAADCTACGKPVPVPAMLVCANKQCKSRLYHDACVENMEKAAQAETNWLCGKC
ncbi:hypothetical protein B0T25DRAFT_311305 [Lasiosphaeria hispida]|uniref:Polycomb protein VEFS-Box domain-containing protein n=1 Tax=Lasiosphaeria hispida TaxID=260671 RepID=A0AAJ0H8T1_9PEZI|nr:hypothetical protein B0T25DRAFT_311305 [Lasiosphaeria hispida]